MFSKENNSLCKHMSVSNLLKTKTKNENTQKCTASWLEVSETSMVTCKIIVFERKARELHKGCRIMYTLYV